MTPDKLLKELKKPQETCPSCGVSNKCMVAAGKSGSTCWCFSEEISQDVAEEIAFSGVSCYCVSCLRKMEEKT